jgi:hypothetical protein
VHAVDLFRVVAESADAQKSRLVTVEGVDIGQVDGSVLEAQYRCSRGHLLITADGNPYEETVHFHLVDEEMQLVDQASLGRIYNSGILTDIRLGAGDDLEFSFFGTERWRLAILADPQRIWPRLLGSVTYPAGWLKPHYLRLEKVGV